MITAANDGILNQVGIIYRYSNFFKDCFEFKTIDMRIIHQIIIIDHIDGIWMEIKEKFK